MAAESSLLATQFATRFLFPFHFEGSCLPGLKKCLDGGHWRPRAPNENYRAEYHNTFQERFFGKEGDWNVLQYDVDLARKKPGQEFTIHFNHGEMQGQLWNQDGRDIELFLSPQGCGAISITATLAGARQSMEGGRGKISLAEIKTFSYRLAQDSQARNRAEITRAIGDSYPATALKALCEDLISPIRSGEFGFRTSSSTLQLIPYTVVRFPKTVGFTSLQRPDGVLPEDDLAAQASLLSQVSEALHPLPVSEDPGAHVRVFHTDEMFAASRMGAALLIADVGTPFDRQKLQSRLDKYFLCFLAALMQRMRLLDLLDEAGAMTQQERQRDHKGELRDLQQLRHHMLATVSRSDLIEISSRDAVNRFYQLCQEAHGVPQALALVQQTVMDLDSSLRAEHQAVGLEQVHKTQEELRVIASKQEQLAGEQSLMLKEQIEHTKHMAAMQNKIEWIEVFIVSFYSAQLVELLGKQFHLYQLYVSLSTLAALLLGGTVAAIMIRPWDESPQKKQGWFPPWRFVRAVLFVVLLIAGYLFLGRVFGREASEAEIFHRELEQVRQDLRTLTNATRSASLQPAVSPPPRQPAASPPPRKTGSQKRETRRRGVDAATGK